MTRLFTAAAVLLLTRAALAQSTFGSINGTVFDGSQAALPAVAVELRNLDENTARKAVTSDDGTFQFLNLKPGNYQLAATKGSFSDTVSGALLLTSRQQLKVDLTMQVAAITTEVNVSATAAVVNTENGIIADTKNFREITGLPTNYRGATTSPLAALATVPGSQQDANGNVSIGGVAPAQVQYSVDGVSAVNIRQNGALPNMNPSSEMISEFRVTQFNNNAEFSQIADVSIVTKSGTNQLHGSGFEYFQNSALDAIPYGFDSKAHKVFHTFGGSLGGPVVLPRLYNGRDKTFFFATYEGNRRRFANPQQSSVPTADQRNGILGDINLIDPLTGSAFPGGVIPTSRLNPVSVALLNRYVPLPNFGAGSDTNANYRRQVPTPADTNGYDLRIDQNIGTRQQLYGRWTSKDLSVTAANVLLPSDVNKEKNRNLLVSYNFTVRPTLINEARFGYARFENRTLFPISGEQAVASLGLQGLDLSDVHGVNAFPTFNFSDGTGFSPIGRDKTGLTQSRTLQLVDNLSWVKGHHTFKFGVDLRHLNYGDLESFGGSNDFGAFTFAAGNFTDNALGDLLLGLPAKSYVAVSGPDVRMHTNQIGGFAQDEWRVTSKLMLSLGLRWQSLAPFISDLGNLTAFDPKTGGAVVPTDAQLRAGFLTAVNACPGVNPAIPCTPIERANTLGLNNGVRAFYSNNWQPRLSFAYRPFGNSNTVFRGGFGIFTITNLGQLSFNTTNINVSVVRTTPNAIVNGKPQFQFPSVSIPDNPLTIAGTQDLYQNVNLHYRDPQAAQWNFTVERTLPASLSLRVSYVGMNQYRLSQTVDLNQVRSSATPYYPASRPYPNWGRLLSSENLGFTNYQGLQSELNRKLAQGLMFQFSHTWAKSLGNVSGDAPTAFTPEVIYGTAIADRFNPGLDRGNTPGIRRNRALLTALYELPIGKGRHFAGHMNRWAEAAVGGWQISTVTLLQTGPFLTPSISSNFEQANLDLVNRGSILRPDRVGNGNLSSPTPDRYFDITAFTPTPAGAGRIGNSGVGILVGPGTVAISGGLSKSFAITERLRARFEATFTNLANHPNFAARRWMSAHLPRLEK